MNDSATAADASTNAVSLDELVVSYPAFELGPISLDVRPGQWVGVIGRSGCGKSTLLRAINLLAEPSRGRIRVFDRSVFDPGDGGRLQDKRPLVRRDVGMVFQGVGLWPYMTLLENVAEGPISVLGMPKGDAHALAHEQLKAVGIADQALKLPREVSGGQAQRAGIARALAMKPKVLLCDEITSGLDPIVEVEILDWLAEQQTQSGLTILMATHRISYMLRKADWVLLLDDGTVVEQNEPQQLIDSPQTEFARQMLGVALR